jgi:L-rhamnose-H+ transport protein
MGHPLLAAVSLTMVAGLMSGTCMLPMKFIRSWSWENLWLIFSVVSLVIIPWMLATGLVDRLFETYRELSFRQLAIPMLFGAGWGVAQILFGISVKRLGLGIAYAIIVGLGAVPNRTPAEAYGRNLGLQVFRQVLTIFAMMDEQHA